MSKRQVSLTVPYSTQQKELERRRQLAMMLQQESMAPLDMPQQPGAQISPYSGLAKILQGVVGNYKEGKLNKEQRTLDTEKQAAQMAELAKVLGNRGSSTTYQTQGTLMPGATAEVTLPPDPSIEAAGFGSQFDAVRQLQAALTGQQEKRADTQQQQGFTGMQNALNRENQMGIAGIRDNPPQQGPIPEGAAIPDGKGGYIIPSPRPAPNPPAVNTPFALWRSQNPNGTLEQWQALQPKPAGPQPNFEEQTYQDYLKTPDSDKFGKSRTGYMQWKANAIPTADMRNKETGRAMIGKSIKAVEDLSKKVITFANAAKQRASAAKMSVEALLTDNPEYKTYQASRQALAGNLAVAQQGSRPSDADIRAIWLPLVPDVFSDTTGSSDMKWDMIRTQSNTGDTAPPAAGGGQGPPSFTLPDGKVVRRQPDGTYQ